MRKMTWLTLVFRYVPSLLTLLFFGAAGCGSSGGSDPDAGGGDPYEAVTVRIDAGDGGTITSADGVFTLTIPAGALSEDTDLTVRAVPADALPAEVSALSPTSLVYDVQPDGLTFSSPVVLAFHWPSAPTPDLRTATEGVALAVHSRSADGTVERAGEQGTVYGADGHVRVAATTTHLSMKFVTPFEQGCLVRATVATGEHELGVPWEPSLYKAQCDPHASVNTARPIAGTLTSALVVETTLPEGTPFTPPSLHWTEALAYPTTMWSGRSTMSDMFFTFDKPVWRCVKTGLDRPVVAAEFSEVSLYGSTTPRNVFQVVLDLGEVTCVEKSTPTDEAIAGHLRIDRQPSGYTNLSAIFWSNYNATQRAAARAAADYAKQKLLTPSGVAVGTCGTPTEPTAVEAPEGVSVGDVSLSSGATLLGTYAPNPTPAGAYYGGEILNAPTNAPIDLSIAGAGTFPAVSLPAAFHTPSLIALIAPVLSPPSNAIEVPATGDLELEFTPTDAMFLTLWLYPPGQPATACVIDPSVGKITLPRELPDHTQLLSLLDGGFGEVFLGSTWEPTAGGRRFIVQSQSSSSFTFVAAP